MGVNIAFSFEGYVSEGDMVGIALGSAGGMKRIQEASGFFDRLKLAIVCGDIAGTVCRLVVENSHV